MHLHKRQLGFSLVELAIVLGILGFVLAGILVGGGAFQHASDLKTSQTNLEHIKQQVLKFGVINKYLPCPDTDQDGLENRTGVEGGCTATSGRVPYLNLALSEQEAEDGWGNAIRYAVNTDTINPNLICDNTSSASMFCNIDQEPQTPARTPAFTLEDTPPLVGNRGAGNYFICNENAVACNGVPNPNDLESDSAVVVLVAYNEDGAQAWTACNLMVSNASNENCDVDLFYHQATLTTEDAVFFDDVITSISGYEVKSHLLSPVVEWSSFLRDGLGGLTPTYEDFDIVGVGADADNLADIQTAGQDVVLVRRNVDAALDLGAGDDYIAIGNDLKAGADLNAGVGDDTVYIVGVANSNVILGDGDDRFVLGTNLTETLAADAGNDHIWVQGDIESGSTLTLGTGEDVLWLGDNPQRAAASAEAGIRAIYDEQLSTSPTSSSGMVVPQDDVDTMAQDAYTEAYNKALNSGGLNADINGGADYDILVLENMTKAEWDADGIFQSRVVDFELVIFSDDGAGAREHCVYSGSSCN